MKKGIKKNSNFSISKFLKIEKNNKRKRILRKMKSIKKEWSLKRKSVKDCLIDIFQELILITVNNNKKSKKTIGFLIDKIDQVLYNEDETKNKKRRLKRSIASNESNNDCNNTKFNKTKKNSIKPKTKAEKKTLRMKIKKNNSKKENNVDIIDLINGNLSNESKFKNSRTKTKLENKKRLALMAESKFFIMF